MLNRRGLLAAALACLIPAEMTTQDGSRLRDLLASRPLIADFLATLFEAFGQDPFEPADE